MRIIYDALISKFVHFFLAKLFICKQKDLALSLNQISDSVDGNHSFNTSGLINTIECLNKSDSRSSVQNITKILTEMLFRNTKRLITENNNHSI